MKLRRLHLAGPQAWPDHVLDASLGSLVAGAAVASRQWAIGAELKRTRGAVWVSVYLWLWAFEIVLDLDGSFEP